MWLAMNGALSPHCTISYESADETKFTIHISYPNQAFSVIIYVAGPGQIDWGDGTVTTTRASLRRYTHVYGSSGSGTVERLITISGMTGFYFDTASYVDAVSILPTTMASCTSGYRLLAGLATYEISIPADFFKNAHAFTDLRNAFSGIYIAAIPAGLFDQLTNAANFSYCFSGMRHYGPNDGPTAVPPISVPVDLFKYCTAATNFSYVFGSGARVTNVVTFKYNVNATNFSNIYSQCSDITQLLPDMFTPFDGSDCRATSFSGAFASSGITSIPSALFAKCSYATNFSNCFMDCKGLTAIPSGLFDGCTSATTFQGTFDQCSGITAIPAELFKYTVWANNFYSCFAGTGITSIPEELFYWARPSNLGACFADCTSLTSIPADLFNTMYPLQPYSVSYMFQGCTALRTVPATLFAPATNIVNFSGVFNGCTNLRTVDNNLFANNTYANNFSYAFENCSSLTVLPDLWNQFPDASHDECFSGCTNASNYAAAVAAGWAT